MKETSGNFIDLDSEEEDGRCSFGRRGLRRSHKRYRKATVRRRVGARLDRNSGFSST